MRWKWGTESKIAFAAGRYFIESLECKKWPHGTVDRLIKLSTNLAANSSGTWSLNNWQAKILAAVKKSILGELPCRM